MNDNITEQDTSRIESEIFDFEELENRLQADLEDQLFDLDILEEDREKIGNPDSLCGVVMDVVWEQFINQVGVVAGEDFIKENRGLKLDLRDSAHIQTTENFEKGKIATHNTQIDYSERHEAWKSSFEYLENGEIKTHTTRTGKVEANIAKGVRKDRFDKGRPTGSLERGTDMDHTVSAGEIIRDSHANTHLTQKELTTFANSESNLNEMDSSLNRSKSDLSMTEWLDNPNSKGQKPSEIFDINDQTDKHLRQKDEEARAEYEKIKKEGELKSIKTGKNSQKTEALRISGKAVRAVVMGLLAEFLKNVIKKLIAWFKSGRKNFKTFIEQLKSAVEMFVKNIKQSLLTAGDTLVTTIATSIFGPIVNIFKKVFILLKQGYKSLKDAINYIKNPTSRNKPFGILMLEVSKILIAGLTAGGAIVLSEMIEKSLMSIPIFAFPIPLLGSLASILGIFFGALVSGIIGAIALNKIDKIIAKKQINKNTNQQIEKKNEVLQTQHNLIDVGNLNYACKKENSINKIKERHKAAADEMRAAISRIAAEPELPVIRNSDNGDKFDKLFGDLNDI